MSSQRPQHRPPSGQEDYDEGALSEEQQRKLNHKKIDLRINNENYLRKHPEIKLMIQDFLRRCYLEKPEDVREFAAGYFTESGLRDRVEHMLDDRERKFEVNKIVQQTKLHDLSK